MDGEKCMTACGERLVKRLKTEKPEFHVEYECALVSLCHCFEHFTDSIPHSLCNCLRDVYAHIHTYKAPLEPILMSSLNK